MAFKDSYLGRRVAEVPAGLRGMAAMLASATTISGMNGVVHHLSVSMHPFEIAFFRQVFGFLFMTMLFMRSGFQVLQTSRIWMHVLRAVLNVLALLAYFVALSLEPIAKVVALGFTAPLFATVLAVIILRERMSSHRLVTLGIGIVGALIILRPGFADISFGMMMVLFSNANWGGALIVIKSLSRTESPVTITMYAAMLMVPFAFAAAVFFWQWPTMEHLYWLIAIGIFGTFAQLCLAQAFREADATLVLPVDFTKLIWASLIGYFFFAEIPDVWALAGAAVIFLAVFYGAWRERGLVP